MTLSALPVNDLLAAFRAPNPAPGGGSAAALAGAIGASLLAMVANLQNPRASNDEETARLREAGVRCTTLATRLLALVDRDTEAYNGVMEAFRLPKGTEEEKATRSARIQEATKGATEAPLEVMRACAEALALTEDVMALGNPNAESDAQVAGELLGAALRGARHNVDINLGSLKDASYVARARQEAERLGAAARA